MQPKKSSRTECPAARALETVGEWWSILILRDAFNGLTRFDQFQTNLGIAPNILSRRLSHLTAMGMFTRRLYSKTPRRYEYMLTAKGRDFFPVLMALFTWGNTHLTPKGQHMVLADRRSEKPLNPIMVDARSKKRIVPADIMLKAGPRASVRLQGWLNERRIGSEANSAKT